MIGETHGFERGTCEKGVGREGCARGGCLFPPSRGATRIGRSVRTPVFYFWEDVVECVDRKELVMEPGLLFVIMISCMVAVGAGIFTATRGGKKDEDGDGD